MKSVAFNAAGLHLAGSWRRRTALLLMTPAAVPVKMLITLAFAPGRRARTCSPSGRISFLYFCPRIFSYGIIRASSHTVSRENVSSEHPYVPASPRTVATPFSAAPLL